MIKSSNHFCRLCYR